MFFLRLKKRLRGKKVGEPFDFVIPCGEAYGETTVDAIHNIPKQVFEVDGKFDSKAVQPGGGNSNDRRRGK